MGWCKHDLTNIQHTPFTHQNKVIECQIFKMMKSDYQYMNLMLKTIF
jgi:hypothetical protein